MLYHTQPVNRGSQRLPGYTRWQKQQNISSFTVVPVFSMERSPGCPFPGKESWQRGTQLNTWEASLLGRAAWRAEIKQQRPVYKSSAVFSSCSSLLLHQAGLGWQTGSHGDRRGQPRDDARGDLIRSRKSGMKEKKGERAVDSFSRFH